MREVDSAGEMDAREPGSGAAGAVGGAGGAGVDGGDLGELMHAAFRQLRRRWSEQLAPLDLTPHQSRALFAVDMGKAIVDVQKYLPWEGNLAWPRRAVLYDLCVNMGIGFPPANGNKGRGLRSFVNSLRAIERGDFQAGAAGLMNSAYARDVASDGWGGRFDRAERLAVQLITGVWQTAKRGRQ